MSCSIHVRRYWQCRREHLLLEESAGALQALASATQKCGRVVLTRDPARPPQRIAARASRSAVLPPPVPATSLRTPPEPSDATAPPPPLRSLRPQLMRALLCSRQPSPLVPLLLLLLLQLLSTARRSSS